MDRGPSGGPALTCSAKNDMTVKTTRVTRTQWVQNFSLSRYTRLGWEGREVSRSDKKKKNKTQI